MVGLLLASYMGVPFHTKNAHDDVGRRLVKHEYPNSEEWFIEDLGISVPTVNVTAYVSTDCEPEIAYLAAEALIEVCQSVGPGPLILPPSTFMLAHCKSCKRAFDKDIQGYISFDLEFWEEGDQGGQAPFQIGLAVRLVAAALGDAVTALNDLAAGAIEALFTIPEAVMAAGDVVRTGLGLVDAAAQIAVVQPDQASAVSNALDAAIASVYAFEASAEPTFMAPPNLTVVQPAVLPPPGAPPAYGQPAATFQAMTVAIANYFQAVSSTTTSPNVLATNLQQSIMQIGVDPTPDYGKAAYPGRLAETDFSRTRSAVVEIVGDAVTVLATITLIQAYADSKYDTRQEAQKARGLMVATVDQVIYNMEPHQNAEHAGLPQLIEARDSASAAILQVIADLQPTVQMQLTEAMPALYLAWRIYQDANRAQELADRNDAPHPMWMPASFEAKSA